MALLGAGAIWVFGLAIVTLMGSLTLLFAAAATLAIFAAAVAWTRLPTVPILISCWATAVFAAAVFYQVVDGDVGAVIFLGLVTGTFAFGAWAVLGFLILLIVDPEMRKLSA